MHVTIAPIQEINGLAYQSHEETGSWGVFICAPHPYMTCHFSKGQGDAMDAAVKEAITLAAHLDCEYRGPGEEALQGTPEINLAIRISAMLDSSPFGHDQCALILVSAMSRHITVHSYPENWDLIADGLAEAVKASLELYRTMAPPPNVAVH